MRFMLLLKGEPPEGQSPDEELIGAMMKYDEELAKAGVLLASEGLHPSVTGARVVYSGGKRTVIDGPFAEAKELVAGFYLIQVKSKEEAIEWAKRCPVEYAVKQFADRDDAEAVIEIRQVAGIEDLPAATDEQRAADQRLRDQVPGF
jgi:hypothetical protein